MLHLTTRYSGGAPIIRMPSSRSWCGLKEKCPPQTCAFEHLVPRWRHCKGNDRTFRSWTPAGGSTSPGVVFEGL